MKKKEERWTEFDATWGIGTPPVESKGIITRVREKLLNYWIQTENQKNQKNT